jgi:hypothetical protein
MKSDVNSNEILEEFEDYEVTDDDFEFIIGPDGTLKSLSLPKDYMSDPPEEVSLILKLYGIDNLHEMVVRTLH